MNFMSEEILLICALLGTVSCQTSNTEPSHTKAYSNDPTSNQNLGGGQRFGFGPLIPGLPNNINLIPPGMPPNPLGFGPLGQQGFPPPFLGQPGGIGQQGLGGIGQQGLGGIGQQGLGGIGQQGLGGIGQQGLGGIGQQGLGGSVPQQNPYISGLQGSGVPGSYAPNFGGSSAFNPNPFSPSLPNTNSINSLQGQFPSFGNPNIFGPNAQGNQGTYNPNSLGIPGIPQGTSNPFGSTSTNPYTNPSLGLQGFGGNFPNSQGSYPAIQGSQNYPLFIGQGNPNLQGYPANNPYLQNQGLVGNSLQGGNTGQVNPLIGQIPGAYPATTFGANPSQFGPGQLGLNPYGPQPNNLYSEFDFLNEGKNSKRPTSSVQLHGGSRTSGGLALPRSNTFQFLNRDVVQPYAQELSKLLQLRDDEFKKLFGRSKDRVISNLSRLGKEDQASLFRRIQKAGIQGQKCDNLLKQYYESRRSRGRDSANEIPENILDFCRSVYGKRREALLEDPEEDMVAAADTVQVSAQ